jgi:hypothetical protein
MAFIKHKFQQFMLSYVMFLQEFFSCIDCLLLFIMFIKLIVLNHPKKLQVERGWEHNLFPMEFTN